MKKKYPFRFEGPKTGDTVYWVCEVEGKGPEIVETRIIHVSDSYEYPKKKEPDILKKTWAIFYYIEAYPRVPMMFGESLFLTREEAGEFMTIA